MLAVHLLESCEDARGGVARPLRNEQEIILGPARGAERHGRSGLLRLGGDHVVTVPLAALASGDLPDRRAIAPVFLPVLVAVMMTMAARCHSAHVRSL